MPHQELKGLLLEGRHVVIALVDKDLHNLSVPLWFSPRAETQEASFKGRSSAGLGFPYFDKSMPAVTTSLHACSSMKLLLPSGVLHF